MEKEKETQLEPESEVENFIRRKMKNEARFAVLIDAENFSSKYVKQLFDEISEEGNATIRRVYGGWEAPQLKPWKEVLETYSISTRQECCYSKGKSSSDSAMIIDAMDILHSGAVDGFCIASSDGDFTNLAKRIREDGKAVLGAGENKTPKAFVNSCRRFIYVDILDSDEEEDQNMGEPKTYPVVPLSDIRRSEPYSYSYSPSYSPSYSNYRSGYRSRVRDDYTSFTPSVGPTPIETIKNEVLRYLNSKVSNGYEGRAYLGTLGSHLRKKYPEFDCRNYQCHSLIELIKNFGELELEELPSEKDSKVKAVYVILRKDTPSEQEEPENQTDLEESE
jgi:hypothetical protein